MNGFLVRFPSKYFDAAPDGPEDGADLGATEDNGGSINSGPRIFLRPLPLQELQRCRRAAHKSAPGDELLVSELITTSAIHAVSPEILALMESAPKGEMGDDGLQLVSEMDGGRSRVFAALSGPCRDLLMLAHMRSTGVDANDVEAFLASGVRQATRTQ